MILTVTLSPAIDVYGETKEFHEEEPIRLSEVRYEAGGKGVNISRVLTRLGVDTLALYFAGGNRGDWFSSLLSGEQIEGESIFVPDGPRVNMTVRLKEGEESKIYKFNTAGAEITGEEAEAMRLKLRTLLPKSRAVIFSGALPPGLSPEYLISLIEEAKEMGKTVCVDSSAEVLKEVLEKTSVEYIKPNRAEAEALLGFEMKSLREIKKALNLLSEKVRFPMMTLSEKGAYLFDPQCDVIYFAESPKLSAVSTVGAGDSFLAGFFASLFLEKGFEDALKTATACAASSVLTPGTALSKTVDIAEIYSEIEVKKSENS